MPGVLTIDQRGSRRAENRAAEWSAELNERFGSTLTLPFTLTVGDEIQAVTNDPATAVEILLIGVKRGVWWLGLGLGEVEVPLASSAARSRGPAFYEARKAVEEAKRSHYGFAIRSTNATAAGEITAVLELIAFAVRRRGQDPSRWRAVELAREGESTVKIGKELGITQQAASKRLLNAGVDEEEGGRRLAEQMIRRAMGPNREG